MTVLALPAAPSSAFPCTRNPDLFFDPEDETNSHRAWREGRAKALCARCPFMAACLEYALTEKFDYGIWGGLTTAGRLAVARRRRDKRFHDRLRERKAAA